MLLKDPRFLEDAFLGERGAEKWEGEGWVKKGWRKLLKTKRATYSGKKRSGLN